MPLAKNLTQIIPEELQKTHKALLDIAFGDGDISLVKELYAPNAYVIGTAENEYAVGHKALIAYFEGQRIENSEIKITFKRIPLRAWRPTESSFCIVDEYEMGSAENISFRMRMSMMYSKSSGNWLCEHVHASVADRSIPEDAYWPIDELKRQNELLEEKVAERTRELAVEASLERIRAEAMGMRSSQNFAQVMKTVWEEIRMLKVDGFAGCSIMLFDEENTSMYDFSSIGNLENPNEKVVTYPHKKKKVLKTPWTKWKKQVSYFEMYLDFTKPNGIDVIDQEYKDVDENIRQGFLSAIASGELTQQWNTFGYFSQGYLSLDLLKKPTEDAKQITLKMAGAMGLAFKRYEDLQQAEAQAKEAQIEAALERIRSSSMAMTQTQELAEVMTVIFEQLQQLKVNVMDGVALITFEPGSKDLNEWMVTTKSKKAVNYHLPYFDHPVLKNLWKAKKAGKETYHHRYSSAENKSFLRHIFTHSDFAHTPQGVKDYCLKATTYATTFCFQKHTALFINDYSGKDLSVDDLNILQRFAKAIDQVFTRFLDLKQAEARTREAQIELALERIRAQASAMQQSEDLLEIMVTMRTEFVNLGHEAHYFWHMKWMPNRYEKAMTSGDGSQIGMVMTLPRHIHGDIPLVADWEKEDAPYLVFPMETEQAVEYVDKMITLGDFERVDPQAPTLDDIRAIGGLTFIMARTSHGEIGYSLPGYVEHPSQEALHILKRFASTFDLAYRRFEDLRKAEVQARQSQIEAAVERVRAEAMAMHQPEDLVKVNMVMLEEINSLGIQNLTGAAFILFDENDILTMWDISDPGNMGNVRDNKSIYDPRKFDVLGDFWRRWKKGEDYFVIEYDFQTVTTALEEWKKVDFENYKNLKKAIDENKLKTQWNPFASFSKGLLTLDLMSEPDTDTQNIMVKMARTFDLAYQRFDDLQKAEEQALQSKKQASMDRIRAEIASMRQKSDLEKLTPFIWMELSTLGVSFFRCGVFIMDSRAKEIDMYLSTPMGDSLAVMTLPFANSDITEAASQAWIDQKVYREKWTKEQFIGWSKGLVQQGLVDSAQTYQFSDVPPEILCLQFLPFKQGMLYIGTEEYLNHNDVELVQDVADAFSIAYTRYEDFERLEKAKALAENALGELRSTQSQLIHAEKMASLGELTAGIAHEIQNPLNFVNNFSDLNKELLCDLREALKEGDTEEVDALMEDLTENEEKIIHHGKRAEDIVKGMLAHSRSGDGKKELTDINALADEFLRLSYHGLRAKDKSFNANFVADLDKSLPKVKVVSQDIGRVLLNLINNAFHATAEKLAKNPDYKPEVTVSTTNTNQSIKISVKDNGSGIPKAIQEKIFQPFFTTKATGSGTGLGLSLSHDIIVKGHEGKIVLESKEGKGTTFTIYLPVE